MVAPLESFDGGFEVSEGTDLVELDIAFAALQEHLGPEVRLRNYMALWRKDYVGDSAAKRYVGGVQMVEYTIFAEGEFRKGELTVSDEMFSDDVKQSLDEQARQNWGYRPDGFPVRGWVRDFGRNQ